MAARRLRKTDHGVQDYEKLLKANEGVKVEKKSIRQTTTKFGMDDRSLGRYIKNFDMKVPDTEPIDDEKALTLLPRIASYANTGLVHMKNNLKEMMMPLAYVFTQMSFQVLIPAWLADEIREQSLAVGIALYQTNWYNQDIRIKKTFAIILHRTQTPLTMLIGPFGPMTLETVVRILQAVFSYATVMKNYYLLKNSMAAME